MYNVILGGPDTMLHNATKRSAKRFDVNDVSRPRDSSAGKERIGCSAAGAWLVVADVFFMYFFGR